MYKTHNFKLYACVTCNMRRPASKNYFHPTAQHILQYYDVRCTMYEQIVQFENKVSLGNN